MNPKLSVKQLAADLGYASLSAFSHAFPAGHGKDAHGVCGDEVKASAALRYFPPAQAAPVIHMADDAANHRRWVRFPCSEAFLLTNNAGDYGSRPRRDDARKVHRGTTAVASISTRAAFSTRRTTCTSAIAG